MPDVPPGPTAGMVLDLVPTVNVFHGIRILTADEGEAAQTLAGHRAYPAAQRAEPPATRVIDPEG